MHPSPTVQKLWKHSLGHCDVTNKAGKCPQQKCCVVMSQPFLLFITTWILCILHVRPKPLASAISPAVLQSNENYLWHLPYILYTVLWHLQNCTKISPLQIIPQVLSVFLLASPIYPPSFLLFACVCVCACEENSIMTIISYFWGFNVYVIVDLVSEIQHYGNDLNHYYW